MEKDETDKIKAFINNLMSVEERVAFKEKIKKDALLEKEVKLQMLEQETAWLIMEQELRKKAQKWDEEAQSQEQKKTPRLTVVEQKKPLFYMFQQTLAIAASVLLIVTVGMGWWANTHFSNAGIIKAAQNKKFESSGSRSGGKTIDTMYNEGIKAYEKGNYQEAIKQLLVIPDTAIHYVSAQYFVAHSHFQAKNYTIAISKFKQLLKEDALPFFINKNELKWDLLLAYVGNNQLDAAFEKLLKDVKTTGTIAYQQKANNLEKDLNSFWRRLVF